MTEEAESQSAVQKHLGSIALAVAILLAVIIHALTTRYVAVKGAFGEVKVVDRWTGKFK